MQETIKSDKAIVSFYNHSTKATIKLKELQEQLNLPNHKLITDRWNSTYYNYCFIAFCLLEQKPVINVTCASTTDKISLSVSEWRVMKQLVQILKPLEEATQELSVEQRLSCSKAIPFVNAILFELQKYVVDEDETQVSDDDDDDNETQVSSSWVW